MNGGNFTNCACQPRVTYLHIIILPYQWYFYANVNSTHVSVNFESCVTLLSNIYVRMLYKRYLEVVHIHFMDCIIVY